MSVANESRLIHLVHVQGGCHIATLQALGQVNSPAKNTALVPASRRWLELLTKGAHPNYL